MAFVVMREHFYPLADTYNGPTANLRLRFPFLFLPGIDPIDQLEALVKTALFSLDILQLIKDNYLSYRLAVEEVPFAPNNYEVLVVVAGESEPASGTISRGSLLSARAPGVRRLSARAHRAQVMPAVFLAPLAIIAIGIALSIVLVGVAIAYQIFSGKWGAEAVAKLLWPFAVVAGGVALIGYGLYGPRRRQVAPASQR